MDTAAAAANTLWIQIVISAGTVLALVGGFAGITGRLKKTTVEAAEKAAEKTVHTAINEAVQTAEKRFEQILDDRKHEQQLEHMERANAQKDICRAQMEITKDMKALFEEFHKKQIRQAKMQFDCHFTTLEALNMIAHGQPINGEIQDQLDDLKDFVIDESSN